MEIARMNYKFTAILIALLCFMALFMDPAQPKNEYLNNYDNRCGELDFRVEDRNNTQDYHTYNSSDYDNDSQNFSITYRKYLGTNCKTQKENVQLRLQLELMRMCGRFYSNPSLALNENFALLVSKCRGVSPARDNTRPDDSQSHWDNLKDNYKKENPDIKVMGDKLLLPPKDYKMPIPE